MDLGAVRAGIATNLTTVAGLGVLGYVPDSLEPPVAVVGWPVRLDFHRTFAVAQNSLTGVDDLEVFLFVGNSVDRAAQAALARYIAGGEIKDALESDQTLGGSCAASLVTHIDRFAKYPVGAVEYLGCVFHMKIIGG